MYIQLKYTPVKQRRIQVQATVVHAITQGHVRTEDVKHNYAEASKRIEKQYTVEFRIQGLGALNFSVGCSPTLVAIEENKPYIRYTNPTP